MNITKVIEELTKYKQKYGAQCIITTEPSESAYDNSIFVWARNGQRLQIVGKIEWD